jgi:hypothetical protein
MRYEVEKVHDNLDGSVQRCSVDVCEEQHLWAIYERADDDGSGPAAWIADFGERNLCEVVTACLNSLKIGGQGNG